LRVSGPALGRVEPVVIKQRPGAQHGVISGDQPRSYIAMSLAVIVAAATALVLLAAAAGWIWRFRSRAQAAAPVTEAEARAHALPLTRSILSVGPRPGDGDRIGLDS
jgi:hypothetical protein